MDMILCTMVTMTLNIYGYDTVYYGHHDLNIYGYDTVYYGYHGPEHLWI